MTTTTPSKTRTPPPGATFTTPPAGSTPAPVLPGMTAGCKSYYTGGAYTSCRELAEVNSISIANFISWNPGWSSSCLGLQGNFDWICTGKW